CYHARRISATETRFLIVSAQVLTYGIGVLLNRNSLDALAVAEGREKELVAFSKDPYRCYVEHPETAGEGDLESPEYVKRVLTHGHWYVARDVDKDSGGAKSPVGNGTGGFHRAYVSRPWRPFPCFPLSLAGKRALAFLRGPDEHGA